jgi:hypothetical protein
LDFRLQTLQTKPHSIPRNLYPKQESISTSVSNMIGPSPSNLLLLTLTFLSLPVRSSVIPSLQFSRNCAPGSYIVIRDMKVLCSPCPAGSMSNAAGSNSCTRCLPGLYQANSGQMLCNRCPKGFYQNASGQATCKPCPKGHQCTATGATKCPKNMYSNVGSAHCKYCDSYEPGACEDCVPSWENGYRCHPHHP